MKLRITTDAFDDAGLSSNHNAMQELARQLTLINPFWQQVCTPALWIAVADTPAASGRSSKISTFQSNTTV